MNQLELISKRILVIAASICAILLCTVLLIKTATPVKAQTVPNITTYEKTYDAVASGSSETYAGYFLIWNTKTGTWSVVYFGDNRTNKTANW